LGASGPAGFCGRYAEHTSSAGVLCVPVSLATSAHLLNQTILNIGQPPCICSRNRPCHSILCSSCFPSFPLCRYNSFTQDPPTLWPVYTTDQPRSDISAGYSIHWRSVHGGAPRPRVARLCHPADKVSFEPQPTSAD